jgi:hypothetical protein
MCAPASIASQVPHLECLMMAGKIMTNLFQAPVHTPHTDVQLRVSHQETLPLTAALVLKISWHGALWMCLLGVGMGSKVSVSSVAGVGLPSMGSGLCHDFHWTWLSEWVLLRSWKLICHKENKDCRHVLTTASLDFQLTLSTSCTCQLYAMHFL